MAFPVDTALLLFFNCLLSFIKTEQLGDNDKNVTNFTIKFVRIKLIIISVFTVPLIQ